MTKQISILTTKTTGLFLLLHTTIFSQISEKTIESPINKFTNWIQVGGTAIIICIMAVKAIGLAEEEKRPKAFKDLGFGVLGIIVLNAIFELVEAFT